MRKVFTVVGVLGFAVFALMVPASEAGARSSLKLINCCLKTADKPGIAECKQETKKDCRNAGGKPVKDCAECK